MPLQHSREVLPGGSITAQVEFRSRETGERLKVILEEVADNLFHADPYYQQGGDMIRCGGVGYTVDPRKPIGQRVTDMTLLKNGRRIEPDREYIVASWACTADAVEGPPIWDGDEQWFAMLADQAPWSYRARPPIGSGRPLEERASIW